MASTLHLSNCHVCSCFLHGGARSLLSPLPSPVQRAKGRGDWRVEHALGGSHSPTSANHAAASKASKGSHHNQPSRLSSQPQTLQTASLVGVPKAVTRMTRLEIRTIQTTCLHRLYVFRWDGLLHFFFALGIRFPSHHVHPPRSSTPALVLACPTIFSHLKTALALDLEMPPVIVLGSTAETELLSIATLLRYTVRPGALGHGR